MNSPGSEHTADWWPAALAWWRRLAAGKFGRDVLWNIGSLGFLAVSGVVMNLLIVTLRDETALGVFNQIFAFYIVLSQFAVGGIQFSVLKHISYVQEDRSLCADITSAALLLIGLISVPLFVLVWVLAPAVGNVLDSADVGQGLRYAVPGLFFFAQNKALINVFNGLRNMRAYAVFRTLRFVLIPVLIVALIGLDAGNPALALALTITEVVLFGAMLAYIYGVTRLLSVQRLRQPGQRIHEHLSFGIRGFLSGILSEVNTRVDVLMLGYFTTDATVGVFSFAAILAEGFGQLPLAVRYNVDPVIGQAFARGDLASITRMARRIQRVFVPVMMALGVMAVVVFPALLWLAGDSLDLSQSWGVFAILSTAVVLSSVYRPFRGVLLQGGYPGMHTVLIAITVVCNVLLNALLIPLVGIYGSALATGITYLIDVGLLVVLARRIWGLRL